MQDCFASHCYPLQPCESPDHYSFYQLIDEIWHCKESPDSPLHRFCSLMRKFHAKSFLREELIPNQELSDEQEMVQQLYGADVKLAATRLTFFCSMPESKDWNDIPNEHILGYAVIVTLGWAGPSQRTYLLEAVVRPPSKIWAWEDENHKEKIFIEPITNYYVHNKRTFITTLGTQKTARQVSIEGSFFTQQNGLTSCCAHAALRMALNSSPLLNLQCKLTNKQINDILEIDLSARDSKPLEGLDAEQIQCVVESLGYNTHMANFHENTDIEYDHYLYPTLESCCPTILGIDGHDHKGNISNPHVVAVLGHTLNSDRWEPQAVRGYGNFPIKRYLSATEWCDHYIISDDNLGMYVTLPSDMIRNFIVPSKNPNLHAKMAMSIVPKEIALPGYNAEQLAVYYARKIIRFTQFEEPYLWLDRLKEAVKNNGLVCRTLLQSGKIYADNLRRHNSSITSEQSTFLSQLPGNIWVTEVTLPNLYAANKRKLGDVIIRTDVKKESLGKEEGFIFAWFPGFIQLSSPDYNLETWGIHSHVPLIRNTEGSLLLEW